MQAFKRQLCMRSGSFGLLLLQYKNGLLVFLVYLLGAKSVGVTAIPIHTAQMQMNKQDARQQAPDLAASNDGCSVHKALISRCSSASVLKEENMQKLQRHLSTSSWTYVFKRHEK